MTLLLYLTAEDFSLKIQLTPSLFFSESLQSLNLFPSFWPFYIVAAALAWCPQWILCPSCRFLPQMLEAGL